MEMSPGRRGRFQWPASHSNAPAAHSASPAINSIFPSSIMVMKAIHLLAFVFECGVMSRRHRVPAPYFMRNFLTDPAWKPEDLGTPLPDSPHAVSVAMPMWQDVVDYEEGAPRVTEALQCGYPRFFVHPRAQEVFKTAEEK